MDISESTVAVERSYAKNILAVAVASLMFWGWELAYQYYVVTPGIGFIALVRGSGLAGATLIAVSLCLSAVFKWYPRTAVHWRYRRYLGVAGFAFVCVHVGAAVWYEYGLDLSVVFFNWNPYLNPVVFGALAFLILFVMAVTSSDLVQRKIGKWWKFIHRFVYVAYLATIFHFLRIDPGVINNLAGQLLVALSVLAVLGQVYWWVRVSTQRKFKNAGFYVGLGLITLSLLLTYLAYWH